MDSRLLENMVLCSDRMTWNGGERADRNHLFPFPARALNSSLLDGNTEARTLAQDALDMFVGEGLPGS